MCQTHFLLSSMWEPFSPLPPSPVGITARGKRALWLPHYTSLKMLLGLQWQDCNDMSLLQCCKYWLIKSLNFILIRKCLFSYKIARKAWLLMVQEEFLGKRTNKKTKTFCCSNPFPVISVSYSCAESLVFISGICLFKHFFFLFFFFLFYSVYYITTMWTLMEIFACSFI